jgi:hypothetical protein
MSDELNEFKDADPVTHQALNDRLVLFKQELSSEQRKTTEQIAQKILDQGIERLERQLSLKRSEESLKRSMDWSTRFVSAAVGVVFGMIFMIAMSECSNFASRLNAIESKQQR